MFSLRNRFSILGLVHSLILRASAMAVGSRHMIDTRHGVAQALHKDRWSLADVTFEVRGKSVEMIGLESLKSAGSTREVYGGCALGFVGDTH
jgi:hypothetical protein